MNVGRVCFVIEVWSQNIRSIRNANPTKKDKTEICSRIRKSMEVRGLINLGTSQLEDS